MNKFESLNNLILEVTENYDKEIIEVSTLEQLYELSGMTGGGISGHVGKKKPKRRVDEMISRKNILTERLMREYIRKRIKSVLAEQKTKAILEEQALRKVIRSIIKEGDISDIHPHRSTGINTLEDVLKKAIPTLRMDYKRLTTDKTQRDSFRSHILKAIKDSLAPMQANDQYLQGAAGKSSALLSEPTPDAEEAESPDPKEDDEGMDALAQLEEADIEVDIADEDKKLPIEKDDEPKPEEEFGTGLEGLDETGRNMAFTSYKKISQYILDAYDSLANPKDKEVFTDYLLTNLKLYFEKFEDELQNQVEEPESPAG
tara:strand:+ start:168 stop:1115 length:948 start_codon:yes stop_codon:yes gene_type:complete